MTFDVAIIGGSYAGQSAALQLARARQRVAVFDAGQRRNRFAESAHGFLSQDGRPPGEIADTAREQLMAYPGVRWMETTVSAVTGEPDAFEVCTQGQRWRARRILLALGVSDTLPDIPGLRERWGRSVFHCPYCHGYELQQGRIGIVGVGPMSLHQALLLPDWGRVTLLLNGRVVADAEARRQLAARGVAIESSPVRAVSDQARVTLADGREEVFAGLFVATRTAPSSPLAQQMGCAMEEGPVGPYVKTDAMQQTSLPGVFACGDLARPAGNVALAVGDGALAGAAVHRSLIFGL